MDKQKLNSFGRFLAVYGAISMVLYFFNMNLVIFIWMDLFGSIIGWILRIVMVVVGLILMVASKEREAEQA